MSAAQLIPMISPDGQPGHVAANEVDAALKAGYRRGAAVTSPKGEFGVVSLDELPAAIKGGYRPSQMLGGSGDAAAPVAAPQPKPQPPSGVGNFIQNYTSTMGAPQNMGDYISGPAHMISHPIDSAKLLGGAILDSHTQTANAAYGQMQQPGVGNKVVGALRYLQSGIPILGPQLDKAGQQLVHGDLSGGSGTTAALATQLAMGRMIPESPRVGTVPPELQARVAAPDVARIVTDTVNPPPKSMASFEKNVQAQLPEVLQGKQITNRAELGQAFTDSAAKAKQSYYDTYINPIKDTSAYGGKTIGQLDARLAEINATLKPTYEKGGAAAQAALSAESKAQLTAEAAQIRNNMNQAIADKLNVPVEQVAAARQKFGQMYDVADKIQLALNKERYSANQAAKKPANVEVTATGLANKGIQSAWRKVAGHPADKALRKALGNYDPPAPPQGEEPFIDSPSQRPDFPTDQPIPRAVVQGSSPEDLQAFAQTMQQNAINRGSMRSAMPSQWRKVAQHYQPED